jgi:RimJ/RimL family protein N-acetyltransferase
VRPTRTSDSGAMQELFYRLSEEDVETRFLQKLKSLTDTVAQYLCSVDYEEEMAFAAVVGPPERERIVAASSYYLSPATGLAEVAYMVDPQWQGAGLGSLLHGRMVEYARERGVRGFRADVRADNARMMHVFRRAGHELSVTRDAGVYEVTMLFT